MKVKISLLLMGFILAIASAQIVSAATFDHSAFDRILKKYVNDSGLVDYNGIAKDTTFKAYMKSLESAKPEVMSQDGQLAFWINAYNAVTIDKVIRWKPRKSVRETLIPGVWIATDFFTSRENTVAGMLVSQDDIENEILRKQLKEPRIHFAIICASSSCPPMPRFAYTEANVQMKLEEETRSYLNSKRGIKIDAQENILLISKIFDWFAGDFESKSGSVLAFIKPYLDQQTLQFLEKNPQIAYIHYDWALNAQEPLQ